MRWHDLFADLEGQAVAWEQSIAAAEAADRSRAAQATVALADRLTAAGGSQVVVRVCGAGEVSGRLDSVGADWLLLSQGGTGQLVRLEALLGVLDLGPRAAFPDGRSLVMARLSLATPLRAIVRDRAAVLLVLVNGAEVVGTPERVGRDYLEVALHPVGERPRSAGARGRMTVPFSALAVVRTVPSGWG